MKKEYQAILGMEHHVSRTRKQMSIENRAAQFAPFAALTGYGDSIAEASRYTDQRREMTEDELEELNGILRNLKKREKEKPEVILTRFTEDERKAGGAYIEARGRLRRIDEAERFLIFESGERISLDDITELREKAEDEL